MKDSIFLKSSMIYSPKKKNQLEEYKGHDWSKNKKDKGES